MNRILFPGAALLLAVALAFELLLPLGVHPGEQGLVDPAERISVAVKDAFSGDLPGMRERGFIRALVTYSRTDFFLAGGQIKGIQADYLREYEKFLNEGVKREHEKIKILFVPVNFDELIPALRSGRGDIAAAFLTVTPERKKQVDFIMAKATTVNEVIVAYKGDKHIKRVDDLSGKKLYVLRASSYVEHLRELNRQFRERGIPPVKVEEADSHFLSEDILEMIHAGVVSATVIDDFKGTLWAEVLNHIEVLEDVVIKANNHVGWAIRKDNPELKTSLRQFLRRVKKGTLLGNVLFKKYFENTRWIKNPLADAERKRYDQYLKLFKKYGERYGFDHLALMAQAFRESGLDHSQRSHRGAIGLMQLLPSTAQDPNVAIPDIKTPENNVHAGTKYLAFLRDRYFSDEDLSDVDRLAFTWAAYNAGPAKVRMMRTLAEEMGRDPNRWFGHVKVAAGRIVGRQTVKYVDDVYKYYVAYQLIERLKSEKG